MKRHSLLAATAVAAAAASLTAAPAVAAPGNPACPGQILPGETQSLRPIGLTVAKPLATSEAGAVGAFLSDFARAEDCA